MKKKCSLKDLMKTFPFHLQLEMDIIENERRKVKSYKCFFFGGWGLGGFHIPE